MKVPSDFFVMSPKVMRHGVIIARFSILKSLLLLAAAAVSMGPLYAVPLDAVGGPILYLESHRQWAVLIAVGWGCGIVVLPFLFSLFIQLVFCRRRAVWLDGDQIVYLGRWYLCVDRHEIRQVSRVKSRNNGVVYETIVLGLAAGKEKKIPAGFLVEPIDLVISRLLALRAPP
jgi:hypothetical protein